MNPGRGGIASLLPHGEAMSLIDDVIDFDDRMIHVRTRSHLRDSNPLRGPTGLPPAALIEYAAQGTAIHGALLSQTAVEAKVIAAVRSVTLPTTLSESGAPLDITCELQGASNEGAIYTFSIVSEDEQISSGRLTLKAMPAP